MFNAINAINRAQRAVHHAHRLAAGRHDQWGDQVKEECDGASDDLEDAKECLQDPTELLAPLRNGFVQDHNDITLLLKAQDIINYMLPCVRKDDFYWQKTQCQPIQVAHDAARIMQSAYRCSVARHTYTQRAFQRDISALQDNRQVEDDEETVLYAPAVVAPLMDRYTPPPPLRFASLDQIRAAKIMQRAWRRRAPAPSAPPRPPTLWLPPRQDSPPEPLPRTLTMHPRPQEVLLATTMITVAVVTNSHRRAADAAMRAATFAATMASNAEAAAVEAYKWKRAVPVSFNTRAQKAKRARR